MLGTLLYFVYVATTIFVIIALRGDRGFLRTLLVFFLLSTAGAVALQYGSVYQLHWDYSRWTFTDRLGLFPLAVNPLRNASVIPKDSSAYWFWTILTTSLLLTVPQSVIKSASIHYDAKHWVRIVLKVVSSFYAFGLGFFSFMITLSSSVAPMECDNGRVMQFACLFNFLFCGSTIIDDIKGGIGTYVPGAPAGGLSLIAMLWRGRSNRH